MSRIRSERSVTTNTIAVYIADQLDLSFLEVNEILRKEHQITKDLVNKGQQVLYDQLVIFKPEISKYGNKSCKARLSRVFRNDLRGRETK